MATKTFSHYYTEKRKKRRSFKKKKIYSVFFHIDRILKTGRVQIIDLMNGKVWSLIIIS